MYIHIQTCTSAFAQNYKSVYIDMESDEEQPAPQLGW